MIHGEKKKKAAGGVLPGTFPVAGTGNVWHLSVLLIDPGCVCQKTNGRTKGLHTRRESLPQMQGSLSSRQIPFFLTNLNPQIFQSWITN